jgi:hypothetical protein
MQVSRTRLLAVGAATGLAGVLTLTAAQASSATSATSATSARAVASPGRTAAAAGTPDDATAKRAAAAREQRGSGGSPADVAAKRAAAAREQRGSGGSPADVAKRAAAAGEQRGPGSDNLLQQPETPSSIARSLALSVAAVRGALRTLVPLSEESDGLDVASRGFVAAAAQLGVSPAQLARAIAVVKAAG